MNESRSGVFKTCNPLFGGGLVFDTGHGLNPHIVHLGRFASCWIFPVTWLLTELLCDSQ